MILKRALLPYREALKNVTLESSVNSNNDRMIKSKQFYQTFISLKSEDNQSPSNFLLHHVPDYNFSDIFVVKVLKEKETKLKEFNFKLLHGILPCNKNLTNWKVKQNENCDICDIPQDICHLIYLCPHVRLLWQKFDNIFGTDISFPLILGVDKSFQYNHILTLLSFLIYKEWLLKSLENKVRNSPITLQWYKSEIELRVKIYNKSAIYTDQELLFLESFANNLC
jgi:hypothetical protein